MRRYAKQFVWGVGLSLVKRDELRFYKGANSSESRLQIGAWRLVGYEVHQGSFLYEINLVAFFGDET